MNGSKNVIVATVTKEKGLWVVLFERTQDTRYQVAKEIFGKEPTCPELYDFVLNNYEDLQSKAEKLAEKKKNKKAIEFKE